MRACVDAQSASNHLREEGNERDVRVGNDAVGGKGRDWSLEVCVKRPRHGRSSVIQSEVRAGPVVPVEACIIALQKTGSCDL